MGLISLLGTIQCLLVTLAAAEKVEYLHSMIEEYKDSYVVLVSFSNENDLDPEVSVPVVLYRSFYRKPQKFTAFENIKLTNLYSKISIFLLCPERVNNNSRTLVNSMSYYFQPELLSARQIYFNILSFQINYEIEENGFGSVNTWRTRDVEYMLFHFIDLNSSEGQGVPIYKVVSTNMFMQIKNIRKRESEFKFVPLPSCVGSVTTCRREMETSLLTAFDYGGRLVIDGMGYTGDIFDLYLNTSVMKHLHSVSSFIDVFFNNPFKSYKSISPKFKLSYIFTYFAMADLDLRIYSNAVKEADVHSFILSYLQGGESAPLDNAPMISDISQFYMNYKKNQGMIFAIPTDEEFWNFVTCDGVGEYLSFNFYSQPYDTYSWITFITMILVIIPITVFCLYKVGNPPPLGWVQELNIVVDTIIFNISLTLEISPNMHSRISKATHYFGQINFVLGIWALMSIILVNAYKGIVTTELTANAPVSQRYVKVNETENFIFLTRGRFFNEFPLYPYSIFVKYGDNAPYAATELTNMIPCMCHSDKSAVIPTVCSVNRAPSYANSCENITATMTGLTISSSRAKLQNFCNNGRYKADAIFEKYESSGSLPHNFSSAVDGYDCGTAVAIRRVNTSTQSGGMKETPFNTALFIAIPDSGHFNPEAIMTGQEVNMTFARSVISECDGIGYIDYDEKIDQFLAMAHAIGTGNKFRKGKERLIHKFRGILLEFPRDPSTTRSRMGKLFLRSLQVMASGIYQLWAKWDRILHPSISETVLQGAQRQYRQRLAEPLTLKSNIRTVFLAFLVCAIFCSCVFIIENIHTIIDKFMLMWRLILLKIELLSLRLRKQKCMTRVFKLE